MLRKGAKKGPTSREKIMPLCTPHIGNLFSVGDASDSPGLRIARNAAYLFVSDICVRVVTVVAAILVARYLGPEQYGVLAVAMAIAGVAGYFTDLGVSHVVLREGTSPGVRVSHVLSGALILRMMFATGTSVVVYLIAMFGYSEDALRAVILIVVLPTLWGGALRSIGVAYFQIIQKMKYIALIDGIAGLMLAGMLFVAVYMDWSLLMLASAYAFSAAVGGILSMLLLRRQIRLSGGWYPGLVVGLSAFTLAGFFSILIPQLGPLLLPHVAGINETGYFTAAFRIPFLLCGVLGIVVTAFYPQLFHCGSRDPYLHLELSRRQLKIMGSLGLMLAIPLSLHSHWLVTTLFGSAWAERSGMALSLLAWVVALHGVSAPLGDALTTQGLQARRTVVMGVAVVGGTGLFWWLGLLYGAIGAAVSTLAVGFILMVGFMATNPKVRVLLHNVVVPIGTQVVVAVPLALGATVVAGSGWFGFLVTCAVVGGTVYSVDREVRLYMSKMCCMIRQWLEKPS